MPKRRFETLEMIKRQASMSAKIVRRDQEYGDYAGASMEDADKMAKVDIMLKFKLIPEKIVPLLKLYRAYLNQRRKAFFASVGSSEITKLGFILGIEREKIKASK